VVDCRWQRHSAVKKKKHAQQSGKTRLRMKKEEEGK
jgi:hypothetical protein